MINRFQMQSGDVLLDGASSIHAAYFRSQPPPAPLALVPCSRSTLPFSFLDRLTPFTQSAGVVESVLHDLISGLPTSPTPKRRRVRAERGAFAERGTLAPQGVLASSVPRAARVLHQSPSPLGVSSASPAFSRLSSASSLQACSARRCSVATQAHTLPCMSVCESGEITASSECPWAGEVRALRDCHLRLVLRQLRHIVHLNRAVDSATCPAPAAPAAHATHAKHARHATHAAHICATDKR